MSEKTEQPTAKKLRDARNKGDVAYSKDFTQTVLILSIFGYLLVSAGRVLEDLMEMILLPSTLLKMNFADAANVLMTELLKAATWVILPFLGIVRNAAKRGVFPVSTRSPVSVRSGAKH